MVEAVGYLLGGRSYAFYGVWFIFSLIGFLISKYLLFKNRRVKVKFKVGYFLKDNQYDIIFGALITYISARFGSALLPWFGIQWSLEDVMLPAVAYGFFYTGILQILRKTKVGDILKSNNYSDGSPRG